MKSSAKKVELAPYDDLFSTEESRQDAKLEKIQEIPLSELHPFKGHPFKVKDDEAMMETADSVRQYGVLVPAIARPDPEGGYELVAGHRRHRASELAEKETMPVIVRDLDDDAATIIMVDSNLQRESLLPSERAFAYKMKLEAMKHQGARGDLTSSQLGTKLRADELLAQQAGSSRNQVQRYLPSDGQPLSDFGYGGESTGAGPAHCRGDALFQWHGDCLQCRPDCQRQESDRPSCSDPHP